MKTWVKVLLIVAACLFGLGLLVAGAGLVWSFRVAERLTPDEAYSKTVAIDGSTLKNVEISAGTAVMTIKEAETPADARVELSGFAADDYDAMTIEQKDGTLTVKNRNTVGGMSILDFGVFRVDWLGRLHMGTLEQRSITVYLPEMQFSSFSLAGGIGQVRNEIPIHAEQFTLSLGTGEAVLSDIAAKDCVISSGTGNLDITSLSTDTLTLSGGTGRMALDKVQVTSGGEISTGTGRLTLANFAGRNITFSSGTGAIFMTGVLTGDCQINGGTGSLELNLLDDAENYKMELTRGMGGVEIKGAPYTQTEEHTYVIHPELTDPVCRVEASTGTGSIAVSFQEQNVQ